MSVLITSQSVAQTADNIYSNGYVKKLNVATIKGITSCKTKKDLLNFMVIQVASEEEIPLTKANCNCIKNEFDITQSCEDE